MPDRIFKHLMAKVRRLPGHLTPEQRDLRVLKLIKASDKRHGKVPELTAWADSIRQRRMEYHRGKRLQDAASTLPSSEYTRGRGDRKLSTGE